MNGCRCQHGRDGSAPLPPLGRRLRRDGDLRQARLRRGRRRRRPAARALRARRGALLFAVAAARGALRGLSRRAVLAGAGDGRDRLRDAVRALLPRARADGRLAARADPLHVPGARAARRGRARARAGDAAAGRRAGRRARPASRSCSPARRPARSTRSARRWASARRSPTRSTSSSATASPACRRSRSPRSSARARRVTFAWPRSRAAGRSSRSAPRAGLAIGAIVLVCTVGAILTFFAGLARVGPSAASILSTLEPVVTVAWPPWRSGSRWRALQLVGGALVLSAVVVMQWPRAGRRRRSLVRVMGERRRTWQRDAH